LGETAEKLSKNADKFLITTDKKTKIIAKVIAIAGGLGNFEPRKPKLDNLEKFENKGIQYSIIDPNKFTNKNVVIAGGGDSALDWTLVLSKIAKKVTLIHRRNQFRGAVDSVNKIQKLKDKNKLDILTPTVIQSLNGKQKLESIDIKLEDKILNIETDYLIPLYGLVPKMDIFKSWGLDVEKNAIKVNNALDYQTNKEGIFAIGDINTYPGKLKLILSGFHEAAIMCHSAYKLINPGKKNVLKYTTVSGISGFDGSKKEPKKTEINSFK
jgi:thioredoxin reductase (NADPH)